MEKVPMGPPRPRLPAPPPSHSDNDPPPLADPSAARNVATSPDDSTAEPESVAASGAADEVPPSSISDTGSGNSPPPPSPSPSAAPYSIPSWSRRPEHPFHMEVLKDGAIVDKLHVSGKGAYMFGRVESCDFVLEHPSISRHHAVLQYASGGEVFLYDLGSTHGTFINKKQVKKKVYIDVHVGDIIRFGQSSRLYIFQGPTDLMPPEVDLNILKKKKLLEESQDREASLLRAKADASLADGISWGMAEDATDDTTENDEDEITWQTFKGQLTERQEKTRGNVIKRMEKVANMKKEIDAIRAKDIAQGGLTQGQQTQIARNEQRIQQIMEELDSLEETLNESIRESVGARGSKSSHCKKKGHNKDEDGDDLSSDDDEFYDRTKRKHSLRKYNEKQSGQTIETADTLLDKKYAITKEMEEKMNLLQQEKSKATSSIVDGEDALDAYMTDLSSELATDTCMRIQEEISSLQSELDRILYLLKIADPAGEAARKRDAKSFPEPRDKNSEYVGVSSKKRVLEEKKNVNQKDNGKPTIPSAESDSSLQGEVHEKSLQTAVDKQKDSSKIMHEKEVYTVTKPQWLGAVRDVEQVKDHTIEAAAQAQGPDQFIDYKDRKKALPSVSSKHGKEDTAAGLIIRKRKDRVESEESAGAVDRGRALTSSEAETSAQDAVALLLKHKRGYYAAESELQNEALSSQDMDRLQKNPQSRKVLGPEKPDFLRDQEYESWVPPEGQSGDGRTSLNEKLGY